MKQNFSIEFNRFLVIYGEPPKPDRVRCLKCKQWCREIKLPEFTMYFCESIFCTNIYELRRLKDGAWRLHDYGVGLQELLAQAGLEAQMTPPKPPKSPKLRVVK